MKRFLEVSLFWLTLTVIIIGGCTRSHRSYKVGDCWYVKPYGLVKIKEVGEKSVLVTTIKDKTGDEYILTLDRMDDSTQIDCFGR